MSKQLIFLVSVVLAAGLAGRKSQCCEDGFYNAPMSSTFDKPQKTQRLLTILMHKCFGEKMKTC